MLSGGTSHPIEVVENPIDDSWFRDSGGPTYVVDDAGGRVALDWVFNAWGEKFVPYADDAQAARRWAEHAGPPGSSGARRVRGRIDHGGRCRHGRHHRAVPDAPQPQPRMTRVEIEAAMRDALGVSTVIWLPHGLALDDDTDGHVDNLAAFARPGTLVVQGCDDPAERTGCAATSTSAAHRARSTPAANRSRSSRCRCCPSPR